MSKSLSISQALSIYISSKEIPSVRNGLGVGIITTSKGVLTDKEAREHGVGGELICTVF